MSGTPGGTTRGATGGVAPPRGPGRRIGSLDVARGLFLIVSVLSASVLAPVPDWLQHPAWFGVTPYDLIFPLFVTLSGIGLAFAYRRRTDVRATARRVVVLIVVGLVYTAIYSGHTSLETLRLTGVLQLYAALVLVAAVLHRVVGTARGWAAVTVGSAVVGTIVFAWFEARCPTGVLSPTCNPSGVLDGRLFGGHMYAAGERGHDPEGVVAICGAFVTAAAGTTAGHIAVEARRGSARVGVVRLAIWAVTCAVLGLLLALSVEPFKRLWTPSFALLAAALGVLIFAVVHAVVDVRLGRESASLARTDGRGGPGRVIVWALTALGRNSLLVYFGSHLMSALMMRWGGPRTYGERIGEALAVLGGPQIAFMTASLALWWAVAALLHRRGIYVRP